MRALGWMLLFTVWVFHFTPKAQELPGARKYGWFFRYLTFNGLTMQVVQLSVCNLADLFPGAPALTRWADDLSCMAFPIATTVTVLFYSIHFLLGMAVEDPNVPRLAVVELSVHIFNSVIMWTEMLLSRESRTFSRRAATGCTAFAAFYLTWVSVVKLVDGTYPYPVLEKLGYPYGAVGIKLGGIAVFRGMFEVGRLLTTGDRVREAKAA